MRMCLKCETTAIGNQIKICPNCGEPFLDYQTMKENSKLRRL